MATLHDALRQEIVACFALQERFNCRDEIDQTPRKHAGSLIRFNVCMLCFTSPLDDGQICLATSHRHGAWQTVASATGP